MQRIAFTDIPAPRGALIILDVDGTLTLPGEREVPPVIAGKVRLLAGENEVVLLSNKKLFARDETVARSLGVPWIKTTHRKPSPRTLETMPVRPGVPTIVVGDKVLTDGLLAFALGARFYFVERLVSEDTPFLDRLYNTIDNCAAFFFTPFLR